MVETHLLMKITIISGTSSMIKGMTGNAGHQGNGRLFKKKSKEPQVILYWPSPSDSLGIWLIDCSASRHFIE